MQALLIVVSLSLLTVAGVVLVVSRRRKSASEPVATVHEALSRGEAHLEAKNIVDDARADAVRMRTVALEEIVDRQAALDLETGLLDERDRQLRDRDHHFHQHRHSYKQRRAEVDAQQADVEAQRAQTTPALAERAGVDMASAAAEVAGRVEIELSGEHADRVAAAVLDRTDEIDVEGRNLIVQALQRQDQGHADGAPRSAPIPLEGLDEAARDRLLESLRAIADETAMDFAVDAERDQATLRGQDPISREVAREAALEVLDRKLQVIDVPPVIETKRTHLQRRVIEVGERALWEMTMEGRPELAELVGTLFFRFSYGQNALLHCQETGYLCGVLSAELGLDQTIGREAGMLHDIGKAVDHNVEGSHAIIGGELLRVLGADAGIIHAVKAHHFDEEPSTDLAMLTICADAISASRPGARRDTLASYLARLEQLQEIATRHKGVERAFPLQAGRELRVVVKAKQLADDAIPQLSHDLAREIEAEMQYPGMIKVTVIRETSAIATAPAQIGAAARAGVSVTTEAIAGAPARRRRRGGRGRKKRTDSPEMADSAGGTAVATAPDDGHDDGPGPTDPETSQ